MHYVLDENKNLVEAYSKEEVLAVIQQAIDNGSLASVSADAGFVSKIKCCVGGVTFKMAFVTQAKYNELETNNQLIENCYYFITDDSTCDEINKALQEMQDFIENIPYRVKGGDLGIEETQTLYSLGTSSYQEFGLDYASRKLIVGVSANLSVTLSTGGVKQFTFDTGWNSGQQTSIVSCLDTTLQYGLSFTLRNNEYGLQLSNPTAYNYKTAANDVVAKVEITYITLHF